MLNRNDSIMPYIFKPSLLVDYIKFNHSKEPTERRIEQFENMRSCVNYQESDISRNARKRLIKCIETLFYVAQFRTVYCRHTHRKLLFRLSFVTLTIPAYANQLTHKQSQSLLLSPFLRHLKRKFNLLQYVWKAETTKRGIIHYHLILDTYIHYQVLRDLWNSYLKRHGLLDQYYNKKGHYNANSTDVRHVKQNDILSQYLSKYLGKYSDNVQLIDSKNWDASQDLKEFKYKSFVLSREDYKDVDVINYMYSVRKIELDFAKLYIYPQNSLFEKLPVHLRKQILSQYENIKVHQDYYQTQVAIRNYQNRIR